MTPAEIIRLFPAHRKALQDVTFCIDTLLMLGSHLFTEEQFKILQAQTRQAHAVLSTSADTIMEKKHAEG